MIGILIAMNIITACALIWLALLVRRYRAEMAMMLSQRTAEQAEINRQREALTKEREEFITTVLHEFNTPLTPLLAYAAMLAEATTLKEAKGYAQDILRTTGRFSVQKMITDARLKPMEITAFEVCTLLEAVVHDPFLYVATRRTPEGVAISLTCEPFLIEADYHKLHVAIWELVRNSLKAIHGRGLISITAQAHNGCFSVAVEDNGRGIAAEKYEAIWLPGVQLFENILTRPNEGSGYGLDTVRKIAQAHGGQARLDWSEEGVGSRFVLELPRR